MKKYTILILTLVIVLMGMFAVPSCKRSAVEDPTVKGPAAFRVTLSGTANPSTLYIPNNLPSVSSVITVRALNNDGTPVVNKNVIFQVGDYGYFTGYLLSDTRATNNNGIAKITYFIPPGTHVPTPGDTNVYIKATLQEDNRHDNWLAEVTDHIPVRVIDYDNRERVRIQGRVTTCCPYEGVPCVVIELTNNGGLGDGLAVSRDSGSYDVMVPWGWFGDIVPHHSGYSFVPSRIQIFTPLYSHLNDQNFTAVPEEPTLAARPITITASASQFDFFPLHVYNSSSNQVITFNVYVVDDTWIRVSIDGSTWVTTINGLTTEVDLYVRVLQNITGAARSGTITLVATDPPEAAGQTLDVTVNQEG